MATACSSSAALGHLLLRLGADVRQRVRGRSCLWAAATFVPDLVPALLAAGADPFDDQELPLAVLQTRHPSHPARRTLVGEMRWRDGRYLAWAAARGSLRLPHELVLRTAAFLQTSWA